MRYLPQESHADLGLIGDDRTPDMRRVPEATETLAKPLPHLINEKGLTIMAQPTDVLHPRHRLAVIPTAELLAESRRRIEAHWKIRLVEAIPPTDVVAFLGATAEAVQR